MSGINLKELISHSALGAQNFTDSYYPIMDTKRSKITQFYRDQSLIVWNGHSVVGPDAFKEVLIGLPSSKHSIIAFNAHPLPMSPEVNGGCCILINVSGEVTYGADQKSRTFSQTFILTPDVSKPNTFFVSNDCFRFV